MAGRPKAPAGYLEIERALRLFDRDEGSRWIAAGCDRINHPAAQEAARLLRAGERDRARGLLGRALLAMAGPEDGSKLEWWKAEDPGDFSGVPERREAW